MILSVRATISSIFSRRSRRFGVVPVVGLQFRQHAAFLGLPIAACRRRRRSAPACRRGLGLQQLPLQLGVAGLQVADVVHRHQVAAGSILGNLRPIAFRRPRQEFRPQALVGRLQGMDLGLQGLDLAGEVGRNLPPAIALGLEELPHAGVLGLQGAGEMGGPGVGRARAVAPDGPVAAVLRRHVGGGSLLTGKGIAQASAGKASQVNVSIEMNEG